MSSAFTIDATGTRARVQTAIANAASRTGVDFSYLLQQAKLESGLNPDAQAATSSASGLYQFVSQSWLGVIKQHGAQYGLSWASDAISKGSDGRYHVSDAATKQAILGLRKDPEIASEMAAEHAADNKAVLESKLGRSVSSTDLYMAHFLGTGGATKFLQGLDSNPDASAAAVLPQAAAANHRIFYNGDGSAKSFAQIAANFSKRFDNGASPIPNYTPSTGLPGVQLASATTTGSGKLGDDDQSFLRSVAQMGGNSASTVLSPSPKTARLAYLMLSSMGVS
ncbi:MAG: lytic transglycosylase domain-containing protein [Sphingomonadaceae bacterium]|nr:lytic transglycosylase domain-containing protein [Sphingomonadaceae bacterium]